MKKALMIPAACLLLASCSSGFEPIRYGKDACAHCKMAIVDNRYAAELLTAKGRAYKFDDVLCLKLYMKEQPQEGRPQIFVEDYLNQQSAPLDASKAVYLKHEFFASPMNGNCAAFATEAEARRLMDSLNAAAIRWENIEQ